MPIGGQELEVNLVSGKLQWGVMQEVGKVKFIELNFLFALPECLSMTN